MAKRTLGFNWREIPAYYYYLSTFLKPRPAGDGDDFQGVNWELALGEPPSRAIICFKAQGVLVDASLPVRADAQFTRDQLRAMLRARDLSPSGAKDELIARLLQHDELALRQATTLRLLTCTDYGRRLAEQYLSDPQQILAGVRPADADEAEPGDGRLSPEEMRRLLRWLLVEGVILGVAGNAVWDAAKELGGAAWEKIKETLPRSGSTMSLPLASGVSLEFCYVPAGPFWMGSDDADPDAWNDEKPRHRVHLDPFWLGRFPITNRQYLAFVRAARHRPPFTWDDGKFPRHKSDHPVTGVNWDDALAFCRWAARVTGRPVRLLTEAEWEKGARGTDGRRYPWGNRWRPDLCNAEERVGETTPVGRYPRGASPYGALDMAGNVWEWTSTLYDSYPYRAADGREDPAAKGWRVLRGGAWYSAAQSARAASRLVSHLTLRYDNYGFRVGVAAPFSRL